MPALSSAATRLSAGAITPCSMKVKGRKAAPELIAGGVRDAAAEVKVWYQLAQGMDW